MHRTAIATIEGAAIGASIALVQHLSLWDIQERVPLTTRYGLGTAAILCGLTHTARRLGRLDLALAGWAIAASTGLVVVGAHSLRRAVPDELETLLESGDAYGLRLPRAQRTR
jgi:hypothetical protein